MKKYISISVFILALTYSFSQELNCVITIDHSQVETQETQVFTEMKANMYDFMNNRTWTDDEFEPEERIKCYITIQLNRNSNVSNGVYSGTARINSVRPIYGTDYESGLMDFIDQDFNFTYNQSSNLSYSENSYSGSLSSLLSFYAYVFLGYDYDSMSNLGGSPHFDKARDIMNQTQSAVPNDKSWNSLGDKTNRYYLIDDITSNQMEGMRKFYYDYHRIAMDQLASKRSASQNVIIEGLKVVEKIKDINPISIYVQAFFSAKKSELVNVFKGSKVEIRKKASNLLSSIDPTNSKVYLDLDE